MPVDFLRSECGGNRYLPQRMIMIILVTLSIIIAYGQRVNFSMVVAEMAIKDNTSISPCEHLRNRTKRKSDSKQEWDQSDQGILLAAFFFGYVLMHLPGGYISDRYGARIIFTLSLCISSILTIFFPLIVEGGGFYTVCVARTVIGLAQASIFPNVTTLMGRWIPKTERATMGGVAFAANSWGIVIGNLLSGALQDMFGWKSVFYVWGAMGVIWYFFAVVWLYSDPNSHPFITDREKDFLNANIKKREKSVKLKIWAILADSAIWALIIGQFGHAYLIFFLATNMPKYFADVLYVNMKKNKWANSLPYCLQWVSSVASGKLSDHCIKKYGWDVAFVRKLYTTIASVPPSIFIVIMPYIECDVQMVVVLLSLSLFSMGPFYSGLKVNVIDLTENFSGIVMAIVNGVGAIAGMMSPYIIGEVAKDHTFHQWKIVMWAIFIILSVTNIVYVIWCKADRREWDMTEPEKEEYREEEARKKEEKAAKKAAKKEEKEAKKAAKKAGAAT